MALTVEFWPPGIYGSSSVGNVCPYCGATLHRGGGMGQRGDRYEWRDEEWCPSCGWRREEVRSLPLSRVHGGKEGSVGAVQAGDRR